MVTPHFNCTQSELIAVANTGWNSYLQHIAGFSAFRGYYDAAYAATAKAAIEAANQLPDSQARYANVEVYRVELTHLADTCLDKWQTLKRYILTSFPSDITKARLEEAGSARYEKARNYNWEELMALNTSGENFIGAHTAALSAGNNMPLGFMASYNAAVAAFDAKYQSFISEEELAYNATEAKVTACNEVHATLMNMFKDGQEIYKNDQGIRRQFTFDTVLGLIGSPGQAGIRGKVASALNLSPIAGVLVEILSTSQSSISEPNGNYLIKPIASGKYDVRFVATGYQDKLVQGFDVLTGTVSTLDVELNPE